ncbi:MAG: formylglycine-generating enzyme family protein [Terriglobia bacterium]
MAEIRPGNKDIQVHRNKANYYVEELGSGVTLEMVEVKAGSFMMGSPKGEEGREFADFLIAETSGISKSDWSTEAPLHQVKIETFFMGKYEVTRSQWEAVRMLPSVKRRLTQRVPELLQGEGANFPVDIVFWDEAEEFCNRLSQYTGRKYRLPSEAEWEYACRAGTNTAYHFGKTITPAVANYNSEDREGQPKLSIVGAKGVANEFGLFDMHGNVAEWCLDWVHVDYAGAPENGRPWTEGGLNYERVLRGGCYLWGKEVCRSAARRFYLKSIGASGFGFRVVAEQW